MQEIREWYNVGKVRNFRKRRGKLMSQTATNTAAHAMLQAAHDRAYRYPENFAGFQAVLRYRTDEESLEGTITIHSPDTIRLELGGREGEMQALQREIASLC